MKRVVVSVVATLSFALLTGLPVAQAGHSRVVLGDQSFASMGDGWGTVRPHTIFNGGDPSGYIGEVHWVRWGGSVARGHGRNAIFKPRGGYYHHAVRIELRATNLGRCHSGGPMAYRHLEVREPRKPGGKLGPWRSWSGAASICRDPYARHSH